MSQRDEAWFRSLSVEEVSEIPTNEQVKVAFLTLSHMDLLESPFLVTLGRIALKELANRGEEKLVRDVVKHVEKHLRLRHMGREAPVSLGGAR